MRPEIPILKVIYYSDTVTKCNGLIILVEGMKTSKLYFCLNAKTEIWMFNANGTKNILIAPLSCKLGPNDYQTTLDKWIDVYSTNDGKLRKINVHKIFLFSCFDKNWNHKDTVHCSGRFTPNSFQDFQMRHWFSFCQFPIPSF